MPRLKAYQWAYIHTKLVIMFIGIFYFFEIPEKSKEEIGVILNYIVSAFTTFGSIVAIVGLIKSSNKQLNAKRNGLILESVGLTLSICGPMSFLTIEIFSRESEIIVLLLVYSIVSFMFARLIAVRRTLRRVA